MDTFIQHFILKISKINTFQGDLTDISAEKEALIAMFEILFTAQRFANTLSAVSCQYQRIINTGVYRRLSAIWYRNEMMITL